VIKKPRERGDLNLSWVAEPEEIIIINGKNILIIFNFCLSVANGETAYSE
jgi:hypothetical protein